MNPAIPTSLEKELQLASEEGSVQLLSNGLINHTWIGRSSHFSFPIVLQQINKQVFKNPQALVNNHQQIHQIWQQQQSRFIIQVRKYWGVLFLTLLVCFFQPIVFSSQALYASVIILTPLACFISFAYATPKRLLIPNLLFWSALLVIVYNHLA